MIPMLLSMSRFPETTFAPVLILLLGVGSAAAADLESRPSVSGDYLEARTAEVFVGYCLANSETGLTGREAILAWRVRDGGWNGEALDGLSVVAVVESEDTLGDVSEDLARTRAVLLVDEEASPAQREALVELARNLAGPLVADVAAVEARPISTTLSQHGLAAVRVADVAAVTVRPRRHEDGLCGNEDRFYPPLSSLDHSHAAYTLEHSYLGGGLDTTWRSPGRSSAFVGTFSR